MWSKETFETNAVGHTKLFAAEAEALEDVRSSFLAYLEEPSNESLLMLAFALGELSESDFTTGLSSEITAEIEKLPRPDQGEVDLVPGRLATNDFRIDSALATYKSGLPDAFADALNALETGQRWLDGGAGEARPMQEYLRGGKASAVAFSYKRPTSESLDQFEESNRARFVYHEGDFAALTGKLDPRKERFDLITDHNGVLMYTRTLSEDLTRYLELLKPGGRMFFVLNPGDAVINGNRNPEGIERWLSEIVGARVASRKHRDGWELVRTKDELAVPPLTLLSYEMVQHSNAPHRTFSQ